jgi:decaprenylphospho-beta-D-ribofuranose 2-oxidase
VGEGREQVLSGWGRTTRTTARVVTAGSTDDVVALVADAPARGVVARGLGRSYNDAAQNAGGVVLDLTAMAHIVRVDGDAGVVEAQAGLSLDRLLRWSLPLGWTVPVTPGTRYVTLGGALAGDVHGKNHHVAGSFADHVEDFELVTGDGSRHRVRRGAGELFDATAGGMGLTGVITSVTLRLLPVETAWVVVDTDRAGSLDELLSLLADEDDATPYSVAWVDGTARGSALGRSVLTRGRHARLDELPPAARPRARHFDPRTSPAVPAVVPPGLINRATARVFNGAWYRHAPRRRRGELQSLGRFFHPLDGVTAWNRLHGPHGFVQYQLVVPEDRTDALRRCLELVAAGGACSLGVLKRLGPGNGGWLSFPRAGWTLAVDLPNAGPVAALLDRLDEVVLDAGGRVNLTKDGRVAADDLRRMYPDLPRFEDLRARLDPSHVFVSDLARRLRL